jgi:hypothetical protein
MPLNEIPGSDRTFGPALGGVLCFWGLRSPQKIDTTPGRESAR